MKKTILFFSFLLFIPIVFALYGGETWTYHFDKCDVLRVNITSNLTIDEGEYTILNNCTKNDTNYYICDCTDDYYFNITFKINTINNYTFNFNYAYSNVIEEQQSSGGGSSSSSSTTRRCIPKWKCTEWGNCKPGNKAIRECKNTNNCYKDKPKEERYCYYYVAKEEAEVIEQVEQPEQEEPPVEEQEEIEEIKKSRLWLYILIGLGSIILLGAGLFLYWYYH